MFFEEMSQPIKYIIENQMKNQSYQKFSTENINDR